jgi:hypothetical protein
MKIQPTRIYGTQQKVCQRESLWLISAYIKKTPETSQVNNLIMHHKFLEKQEQTKPKTSRWRK